MLARFEAFLLGTFGKLIGVIAVIAFAYWFGGHNATKQQDAVDTAVTRVASQAGVLLTTMITDQVGGINARLSGDSYAVQLLLKGGLQDIPTANARILSMPGAGLYVKAVDSPTSQTTGTPAAASGPGHHATYRAELSDESRAFLAGEAARAQQCAVQLQGAQKTLVSWAEAVNAYNLAVADPAKIRRVELPKVK